MLKELFFIFQGQNCRFQKYFLSIYQYIFLYEIIFLQNVYKDEYNSFFKGIGWIFFGFLEVETVKKVGDVLNERKYRQYLDIIKFISVFDFMGMVLVQ